MADKLKKRWYIGFAVVLGSIGTFIATTDTVFHYKEIFSVEDIDTTKTKEKSPFDMDSIDTSFDPQYYSEWRIKRDIDHLYNLIGQHQHD